MSKLYISAFDDSGITLLFERFVKTINKVAVTGYFYRHENKYLILGDYYYWYMPFYPDNMAVDLINRATVDYLELRDGAYHYKPGRNMGAQTRSAFGV